MHALWVIGKTNRKAKGATQLKTVQRFVCASGGTRTHKPVRASDFKSDAYANSATEAAITYYAIYLSKEQAQRVASNFLPKSSVIPSSKPCSLATNVSKTPP